MKEKLTYKTDIERMDFVCKYQGQNIADDLPNKTIYCLDDNEYFENGEIKVNENFEKEKTKQEQTFKIKQQLDEIDIKSIRALRANEADRLSLLENQAINLRTQLNNL